MKTWISSLIIAAITLLLHGCATPEQKLMESGANKLSNDEITQAFSNVREKYDGLDTYTQGVTAIGRWGADGSFSAEWKHQDKSGKVDGKWYAKDARRCIEFTEQAPDGSKLECVAIYRTGDTYTSVNPNGSIHGIHKLAPLAE